MRFKVYGPFEIPLEKPKKIPVIPKDLTDFWDSVERREEGLAYAKGVYVFAIRSSGGSRPKPWYVGKTNKQVFSKECFRAGKRNHYHTAIANYQKGKPVMFLIPKFTKDEKDSKFSRSSGGRDIDFMEKYFIAAALKVNDELCNKMDTRFVREIELPGFFNSGPGDPGKPARELRQALKLK